MQKIVLLFLIMAVGSRIAAAADFSGRDIRGIESIVRKIIHPQEPWRLQAERRINKYRKAELKLKVVDAAGKPITGATVIMTLIRPQFRFGAILRADSFRQDSAYRRAFYRFGFNAAGFCNALKYKLHRIAERNHLEKIIAELRNRGIYLRGHCLIWPGIKHLPKELRAAVENYNHTAAERRRIRELCRQMISAWAAKWDVDEWDVINEPRGNEAIQKILGKNIEAEWFKTAEIRMRNHGGLLYLNENRVISDPGRRWRRRKQHITTPLPVKSDKVMRYYHNVEMLLAHHAPISALGFQSRFAVKLPAELINRRLQLFSKFHLPIAATEFEMKPSVGSELEKALMTERVMTIYFSRPEVNGIYAWTLLSGKEKRGLLNRNYCPNLRGKVWLYLTKQRWNSNVTVKSDQNGSCRRRLFKGTYRITVHYLHRKSISLFKLSKDSSLVVRVQQVTAEEK